MIETAYTAKRLLKHLRYSDLLKDRGLFDHGQRIVACGRAYEEVRAGTYFSANLSRIGVRGKVAYRLPTISSTLVARLAAANLRSQYRISPADRNAIVQNLLLFLRDGAPCQVHRFDVESFYESVDREKLIDALVRDGKCARQTLLALQLFFDRLREQEITGLPRGVGLSATLAEYALRSLDNAAKANRDIFFYARFVDDIVVVSAPGLSGNEVERFLKANLFPGLRIHSTGPKRKTLRLGLVPKNDGRIPETAEGAASKPQILDYLGYRLMIYPSGRAGDQICGMQRRRVDVDIAPDKLERLSKRVILSFTNFMSNRARPGAFALLENRLKALTGNYVIRDPISRLTIKTGIYYNYYQKNNQVNCPLVRLDALVRGLLFSNATKLSRRIQNCLTPEQRKKLAGYTFRGGFYGQRMHSFTNEQLRGVKQAWQV